MYRVIVLRGTCQLDGDIIDHHPDEEGKEYPAKKQLLTSCGAVHAP